MISFTHSFIHKYFTELLTCGKNREYKGYWDDDSVNQHYGLER
jgi:hypothetical protein